MGWGRNNEWHILIKKEDLIIMLVSAKKKKKSKHAHIEKYDLKSIH